MKGSVAVVGGGIAGIQAALDLADSGFKTYLIESRPSIGGVMSQLDKTFPTNDCAMCILSPKLVETARHPNIELLAYSDVKSISGKAGDFKVKVVKKARYVDETKCTGCGSCTEKCPSKVADEYNAGMAKRKSIYIPFAQAIPRVATIDAAHCLYLTKSKCGVCKKVCGPKAVDYEQKDKEIELNVGSVVLATGFKPFDPSILMNYRFDHPDVITALQFERLLSASGPTQG
ncbi:MAG: FAD-dependent oxidoreductase, partial [Candidatus Methanoperedens sp.]